MKYLQILGIALFFGSFVFLGYYVTKRESSAKYTIIVNGNYYNIQSYVLTDSSIVMKDTHGDEIILFNPSNIIVKKAK